MGLYPAKLTADHFGMRYKDRLILLALRAKIPGRRDAAWGISGVKRRDPRDVLDIRSRKSTLGKFIGSDRT